jgi:uncharacterized protein YbjT (DUF2867 family)
MLIAVTGGTGAIGREVVAALAARGHEVRALSRSGPIPVDLSDGSGLDAALDGVEAVIDAANAGPAKAPARAVLVDGNRRLLEAESRAGVAHHVAISIVGIDRLRSGYYGVKLEQEAVVRDGGVPWTIVRATQVHGLLDAVFAATARFGVLPGGSLPLQPVDARDLAQMLADTVDTEPWLAVARFAGPEVVPLGELARLWREARGRRALVTPFPTDLLGRVGRELAAGALTDTSAWHGRTGFAAWLRDGGAPAASPAGAAVGSTG